MVKDHFQCLLHAGVLLAAVGLLAGCQTGGSGASERTEYFTWVDDQGRVRHSPIQRERIEDVAAARKDQPARQADEPSPAESGEPGGTEVEEPVTRRLDPEDEYTLENYPDGDQLEKDGYVRPGDPQPYFTWRDAEGNIRVSYYRPDTRSEVEKGRVKPPIELTPASVHSAGNGESAQPYRDQADPEALAILGIETSGVSYFEEWSAMCCSHLSLAGLQDWIAGREFRLLVDEDSPLHDFATGRSHYRLVRLPDGEQARDFVIRLRSFAMALSTKRAADGAKDGLFVPSVAFLDSQLQPIRIVTDLVADFTPESWHRHGYLEAHIPVFPNQGERWMVLFTTEEDQQGQTVVEDRRGPKAIRHSPTGVLSLTGVESP